MTNYSIAFADNIAPFFACLAWLNFPQHSLTRLCKGIRRIPGELPGIYQAFTGELPGICHGE